MEKWHNEKLEKVGWLYSVRMFRAAGIPAAHRRTVFRPHVQGCRYSGCPSADGIPAAVKKNMATSTKNDECDKIKCGHTAARVGRPCGYFT